ncbi:N-6 DNA methylase [Salegentibacter sp. LM13S]|uniref:N-6 DNA methylase n=1 Tax=Salegentibacter lacus TaxID=2873599 RepID=UPI001CD02CE1|nr:N-6 DNA methylase [Salegentibacter lacus]MBZ9631243.1 N-6 DNA methylase [Salegentibacter lacus]
MIPLLATIALFQTVRNLYKSNLSDQEVTLLECFLLLMEKEELLNSLSKVGNSDAKRIIYKSSNIELIQLYDAYLKEIVEKARKPFFSNLCSAILSATEQINDSEIPSLFDSRIKTYIEKQSTGDELQPKELTLLLNHFLPKDENQKYYNPFGGLASLAIDLPSTINYYGEELNISVWLLAKMRMMIYDCPAHFLFKNKNSIEGWCYTAGDSLYDYISYNPPFNLQLDESFPHLLEDEKFGDYRNANTLIVSQTFKKLKKSGTMSFVMPNGFLSSNKPKDKAFRKYLSENNYLKYVISLPEKILHFTSISVNVIVLSKEMSGNKIRFVDGSDLFSNESGKLNKIDIKRLFSEIDRENNSKLSKSVDSEFIAENDYNLSINRYVFEKPVIDRLDEIRLEKLSDIISLIPIEKPTQLEARLINIGELSDDKLNSKIELSRLPIKEVKSSSSLLSRSSMLIATLGNSIKPTLFQPDNKETVYERGKILAFTVDTDLVLPEYLVMELHKDYVQNQLDRIRSGSGIPRIRKNDLLKIEIVVPTFVEQERKLSREYHRLHQEKLEEVKKISTDFNIDVADENSFLRHQIAGSMKNLRSAFKFINKILEDQVKTEMPDLYNLKANDKLSSTLGDYLRIMDRDLSSVTKILNKAGTEIDLTELEVEKIDLIRFVENYKKEVKSRNGDHFLLEVNKDKAALLENDLKTVYILGDKEKLRQVFDNIVANALKHGFDNKIDSSNKIVFEFIYDFKNAEVQLDISNSGNPLPPDYSHGSFIRKGSSSGKNAGDGTGGWFINEVMKLHKGHFGFTDETGPEGIPGDLVTTIELTFPIILKQ